MNRPRVRGMRRGARFGRLAAREGWKLGHLSRRERTNQVPSEPFFWRQIRTARPVPVAKVEKQQLSHRFWLTIICPSCGGSEVSGLVN